MLKTDFIKHSRIEIQKLVDAGDVGAKTIVEYFEGNDNYQHNDFVMSVLSYLVDQQIQRRQDIRLVKQSSIGEPTDGSIGGI